MYYEPPLALTKPKRSSNGTYKCHASSSVDSLPYTVKLDKSYLVMTKSNVMYFKTSKSMFDLISRISDTIVSTVQNSHKDWFNQSSLSEDMVEEYFCHPIIYDKTFGDLLRLKLVKDDNVKAIALKKRVSFNLTLHWIRIYKQKFIPEWEISNVIYEDDPYDDTSSIISDNDDIDIHIPFDEIKREHTELLTNAINDTSKKLDTLQGLLVRLKNADTKSIPHVCDEIQTKLSLA